MNELKDYFNAVSKLNEATWDKKLPFFSEGSLMKNEYFAGAQDSTQNHFSILDGGLAS